MITIRQSSARWAPAHNHPKADVDVLLPTCNRPGELAVTLAGLAAQDGPAFRLVLSDQSEGLAGWEHGPVAAILRVLRVQGTSVELLRHLPRRGLAEHRQFLLDHSSADQVLFLDDDVWLEPGSLTRMTEALEQLGCGFVGMAPQGLSYVDDRRPSDTCHFEPWQGPVTPERIRPNQPGFERWPLHSAANLVHLSEELQLQEGQWIPYKVAWIGGCTMYRRTALESVGGFKFWNELPPEHSGEDVAVQWRVMECYGGAGILPSGAVHLESPTTIPNRPVEAFDVVFKEAQANRLRSK